MNKFKNKLIKFQKGGRFEKIKLRISIKCGKKKKFFI